MKTDLKHLLAETATIALIAAAVGLTWNHRLLLDVYHGRAVQSAAPPAPAGNPQAVPLPLGLMQVKELFDRNEALIIDARDRDNFAAGHIREAISLPLGDAERLLPAFTTKNPKERLLVVYCNGFDCHDSKTLGEKLLRAGFQQVFVFEGGYPEWRDAGYPVDGGKR